MKLCRLGNTSTHLTPIGLGCWQFSMGKGIAGKYWKSLEYERARAIVKASLEGGVNWFDTAEAYGEGMSEQVLAKALTELGPPGKDVFIATKWMPAFRTASHITKSIHKRIAALDPHPIELYQIHLPISLSSIRKQMLAMLELVRKNRIRAIGVSNFSAAQVREAHSVLAAEGYSLASNQIRYSLLDRDADRNGVLETCRELGVTAIAYSPLGQGVLSGKFHRDDDALATLTGPRRFLPRFSRKGIARSRPLVQALQRIAAQHDASCAQVALAAIIQLHSGGLVAIPGATSVEQARGNAGAIELELDQRELQEIDSLSLETDA